MRRLRFRYWLIPSTAFLLMAQEPAWQNKPVANWTDQDAQQILEHSPWAKIVVAGIARRQTEDERREGGNMGQPKGVGYDGVEDKKIPLRQEIGNPLVPGKPLPSTAPTIRLLVRWESAFPIRAAELKAHAPAPPTLSDDGYSIAVYGVPSSFAKGDPISLGKPLKESAFLRREGKSDVKPVRVEVFELENSVAVVYLFPLSAEIGRKDAVVEFAALIGRLQISQHFNLDQMLFQGKLEL